MKRINHSVLIVSIAAAIFIIGGSIALGILNKAYVGLITGISAFMVLITCMLFANRHIAKKDEKKRLAMEKAKAQEAENADAASEDSPEADASAAADDDTPAEEANE